MSNATSDHNGTYAVNLINPTAATINLIAFYNADSFGGVEFYSIVKRYEVYSGSCRIY